MGDTSVEDVIMFPTSLAVIKPTASNGTFNFSHTPQYGVQITECLLDSLKRILWPQIPARIRDDLDLPYYHLGHYKFTEIPLDLYFFILFPRWINTGFPLHQTNTGNLRQKQLEILYDHIVAPSVRRGQILTNFNDILSVHAHWATSHKRNTEYHRALYGHMRVSNRPPIEQRVPCAALKDIWEQLVSGGDAAAGSVSNGAWDFFRGSVLIARHVGTSTIGTEWAHFSQQWNAAIDERYLGRNCKIELEDDASY